MYGRFVHVMPLEIVVCHGILPTPFWSMGQSTGIGEWEWGPTGGRSDVEGQQTNGKLFCQKSASCSLSIRRRCDNWDKDVQRPQATPCDRVFKL